MACEDAEQARLRRVNLIEVGLELIRRAVRLPLSVGRGRESTKLTFKFFAYQVLREEAEEEGRCVEDLPDASAEAWCVGAAHLPLRTHSARKGTRCAAHGSFH